MKYRVGRTSDFWGGNKPCSKAFTESTEDYPTYYIEINTLEELNELIREVGCQVIIDEDSIEIYDGYRE